VPKLPLEVALGLAIRELRDEQGVSQEQLGLKTGLHRNHVGQIERAEMSPTLRSIELIAAALDRKPSELLALAETLAGGRRPRVTR
jgi:transcriptional regulator with XRE-family HTH domain